MQSKWADFKTIKESVAIGRVLDHYGVKLKLNGQELRGRCPIHNGDNPDSLSVNTAKNVF